MISGSKLALQELLFFFLSDLLLQIKTTLFLKDLTLVI